MKRLRLIDFEIVDPLRKDTEADCNSNARDCLAKLLMVSFCPSMVNPPPQETFHLLLNVSAKKKAWRHEVQA